MTQSSLSYMTAKVRPSKKSFSSMGSNKVPQRKLILPDAVRSGLFESLKRESLLN